jgi:hypothetical protein
MGRVEKIAGNRKRPAGAAPSGSRRHPELSIVSLVRDVEADGRTFPAGARGTIVAAYADGEGYEVEFFEPMHGVVTVGTRDIAG